MSENFSRPEDAESGSEVAPVNFDFIEAFQNAGIEHAAAMAADSNAAASLSPLELFDGTSRMTADYSSHKDGDNRIGANDRHKIDAVESPENNDLVSDRLYDARVERMEAAIRNGDIAGIQKVIDELADSPNPERSLQRLKSSLQAKDLQISYETGKDQNGKATVSLEFNMKGDHLNTKLTFSNDKPPQASVRWLGTAQSIPIDPTRAMKVLASKVGPDAVPL